MDQLMLLFVLNICFMFAYNASGCCKDYMDRVIHWSRKECLVSTSTPTKISWRLLAPQLLDRLIANKKRGGVVVEGEEVVELHLEGGVVVMGLIGLVLLVAEVEGQQLACMRQVVVLLLGVVESWKGSRK